MKLRHKLPLSFGVVLLVMLLAAGAGLYQLSRVVAFFQTDVEALAQVERQAVEAELRFRTQVQEWKNVLLRGYDAEQLDRFWTAFQREEAAVAEQVRQVMAALPDYAPVQEAGTRFLQAHEAMARGYRRGFASFEASLFDSRAGDQAVAGMDRQPAQMLRALRDTVAQHSAEVQQEAARLARLTFWISGALLLLAVIGGIVFAILTTRAMVRPLDDTVTLARRVAAGDLTSQVEGRGRDEIAVLRQAMQDMQAALAGVVTEVRYTADALSMASQEIASGNQDLSARTESQAGSLEETAASMEQLNATVHQNADHAVRAHQLAGEASAVASEGGRVVTSLVQTMQGITQSSQRIGDIIGVIDSIAFPTNIWALNAAVEAARAETSSRQADQAGGAMTQVVASIDKVTQAMGAIMPAEPLLLR